MGQRRHLRIGRHRCGALLAPAPLYRMNPSATHVVRSGMNDCLVTGSAARGTAHPTDQCRFRREGDTSWGPFPTCHTTAKRQVFDTFLLPTFLWQGRPEGSPLGGQRKAGAAPHRGNANKPISNQGKAKNPNPRSEKNLKAEYKSDTKHSTACQDRQHKDYSHPTHNQQARR